MNGAIYNPGVDSLKQEAARAVLGWQGDEPEPGRFTMTLLDAWSIADSGNRKRLGLAFPYLGAAFNMWNHRGVKALRKWGGLDA